MIAFEQTRQIILPYPNWQEIQEHCKRKLAGHYLQGETKLPKACGLVAGTLNDNILKAERILPLKRNVREIEPYKAYIDEIMKQHAVPSKTPFSMRGWITDPEELKEAYESCDQENLLVFGSYHVHAVPWKHDPLRDTPTHLDTVLAKNSNLYSFIVSMVDIALPKIRAFYEGRVEKETPVIIEDPKFIKGG